MKQLRRITTAALMLFMGFAVGHAAAKPMAGRSAAQLLKVQPADCAGCHKDQRVLPAGHVATRGMALKDCQACHGAGEGQPPALATRIPGSHLHALNGVRCGECHDDLKSPKPVPMWKCASCHDPKDVAGKTANVQPHNPHASRHYGNFADCNKCHHQHVKSENDCLKCHKFDFQVP